MSRTCKAELSLYGRSITSGTTLSEPGSLQLKVTDEAGNAATATIKLTRSDSEAPTITISIGENKVIAGVTATINDNQLLFDDEVSATWTDDYTKTCKAELSLTPEGATTAKTINSGDELTEAGTLKLTVADDFQNAASTEIKLTAIAVYGLENLANLQLQVDQEVNLMEGLTLAEGLILQKVEVIQDDVRTEVKNLTAYVPDYPGAVVIIFSFTKPDGSTIETSVDNLLVKALDHNTLQIISISPEDILPFV